jgi:arabinofuranan 3-O-arabinosyltransferase
MTFATSRSVSPSTVSTSERHGEWIKRVAFALVVSYAVFLAASFAIGVWLVDSEGKVIPVDFVNVWAAGKLVLDGRPADAFDWVVHKAMEETALGGPFEKYFGWHYPPAFLFVAAALATLPYLAAFLVLMAVTLAGYVAVIRTIVADRLGILLACAFPAILWNFSVGQNGFLTAALLGAVLGTMQKRPLLAGVFLGLLSYKPQFGILFPLVLALNGYWRTFFTAAATTIVLCVVSWLAFGRETWEAFFEYLPLTGEMVLSRGHAGFQKLQTFFGVVRWFGGGEFLAWTVQVSAAVASTIIVLLIWRARIAYEIKAAALACAALIVTPYLYVYDLVALAVPMAFVIRMGLRDGFLPYEVALMTLASALVLVMPIFTSVPTGLMAIVIVWSLICRRAVAARSAPAPVTA